MLKPSHRLAILLHEGITGIQGKTGLTLLRYSPAQVVCAIDRSVAGQSLVELTGIRRDVPIVDSIESALDCQPDVLAIGIAPSGGIIPASWMTELQAAVAAGLSIVNGLHTPLANHPQLAQLLKPGQWIWDVRQEPQGLKIGTGAAKSLPCQRVLMVGTDMAIGKMSAALELQRSCELRGVKSKFIATGQAGMMISGEGVALDAVRVDYAAGAVEQAVLRHGNNYDLLLVEGQGSLLHPGSTATLPLIRGSQPTQLILLHKIGQETVRNCPDVKIPPLVEVVRLYESVASCAGAFGTIKVVAIALNGGKLSDEVVRAEIDRVTAATGLPCTDAVRFGADVLLDAIINSSDTLQLLAK
jgi:uncharacterized NAD-dependent epimerase/dehydratase family protein